MTQFSASIPIPTKNTAAGYTAAHTSGFHTAAQTHATSAA